MTYSRHIPAAGLSWFQRLIWPLIFAQLWTLKLWVRKHYGRGVPYRIQISPIGRVFLVRFPMDIRAATAAELARAPAFEAFASGWVRAAFRFACAPEVALRAPAPELFIRTGTECVRRCALHFDTS